MATYTIKVTAGVSPCNHVLFTLWKNGVATNRRFVYHMDELKAALNETQLEDMLLSEIKYIAISNPTATKPQLKALIEAKTWEV